MMSNGHKPRGALSGVVLTLAVLTTVVGTERSAHAQGRAPSADELKAARELFQDAFRDEQEKRFAAALEKFQRVAAVKESASVRYRIATVLASLGRLREARDAFRALAASKNTLAANEQEIADSSAERAQALDRRIPRLVLRLEESPPPGARVTVDGALLPVSTTARAFEVDPGEHLVQATAGAARSSESRVTLQEGGEAAVTVVLPPLTGQPSKSSLASAEASPPDTPSSRNNTLALVALGAGGVLLVTGIALLIVREGDISDLNKDCHDVCPSERRTALESTHDQAQLFGPLGVGFGVVGLLAAGGGGYLLFRSQPSVAPGAATNLGSKQRAFRVAPQPVRGGAGLGVFVAF